jgi:FKBP-type peptidyl-prolyl cis-trans isomerase SlyD
MTVSKIENGVVVSMAFRLVVENEEIDFAGENEPLEYLHGAENIVPGLETALTGRQVGDTLQVTVSPEEGYGEYDEEDIFEFDRAEIPGAENLEPGMFIEIEDEDGYIDEGIIQEVTAESVVVDFNHPLSGKVLNFDVKVVALRAADAEELEHGHPHSLDDFFDEDEE